MDTDGVARAVAAVATAAAALDLPVHDVAIIQNSNRLSLRLLPCDVFARVAPMGQEVAALEVELAQQFAASEAPVAALETRVEPRVYQRDGFAVTLWTYCDGRSSDPLSPTDYAHALERLHAGMRNVDVATPHVRERVGRDLAGSWRGDIDDPTFRNCIRRRGRRSPRTDRMAWRRARAVRRQLQGGRNAGPTGSRRPLSRRYAVARTRLCRYTLKMAPGALLRARR